LNCHKALMLYFVSQIIGIVPAYAAQSPDQPNTSAPTPATTAPAVAPAATPMPATVAAAPASPSVEVLKRARLAGYHIKKLRESGSTVFCKKEASLGSRFVTESCIDETQLEEFLIRAQDQRDKLQNRRGTGTDYN
jgi:hypothetical protein